MRRTTLAPFFVLVLLLTFAVFQTSAQEGAETDTAKTDAAQVDPEKVTALHDAARDGDLAKVRELLDAGVPVDAGNHYEVTALIYASVWGHIDVVRELLERGADINHVDNLYGSDAMGMASNRGQAEVVKILVEHGADADSAFFGALSSKDLEAVRGLLSTGKISQKIRDAALSRVTLDEDDDGKDEMIALLEKAGAKLPPPSAYKIAPEVLARYVGIYAFERQPDFKIELKLEDSRLVAHIPGPAPAILEALDDFRFRQVGSTFFELRFDASGETVKSATIEQVDSPQSFVFLREAAAPALAETSEDGGASATTETSEGTAVAEATPETGATPEAATKKHLPVPKVATREWSGFRGTATSGAAQGSPPTSWNVLDGTHILWKTPIPGRSHASPIAWGEKIFIATAVASTPEKPFRTGLYGDPDFVETEATYSWRLLALDRATGKVLWEHVAHEGKPRAKHHIKATQMNATPVTDGHRVVTVMGSEGLFCHDMDGKLLWRQDLGTLSVGWFYDEGFEWGHSSSPILHGDRVILQVDRAREPFIAAYSLEDGREVWRTSRDNIPSWGTPALLEGPKGVEIVTNGSRKIRGYDADTGRELWNLGPHSEVTVGSVVTGHGLAFAVGNWAPIRAIYAIRPGGRGDISLAEDTTSNDHIAWHYPRGGTYTPTPLVYGDTFYTLASNGILVAYDAATGERVYRARVAGGGGEAFSASPIAAGGRLYIASEDGDVYVVRHDREFELLEKNTMDEIIMASPAVTGDILLVRTLENLYAIGEAR